MSTKSETDFEWSIKCFGTNFRVGITSMLKTENVLICEYDPNSIVYHTQYGSPVILAGSTLIHRTGPSYQTGDVIRFRFQPQKKKLLIDLVRILMSPTSNSHVKNGHYEIDLRDNVNYFPVIQSGEKDFEAHLIT